MAKAKPKMWGAGTRVARVKSLDMGTVDFALLAVQKRLLGFIKKDLGEDLGCEAYLSRFDVAQIEALIGMIERIQEQAEKKFGRDVVYGSILRAVNKRR